MDQSARSATFLEFVSTLTGVSQKVVGQAQNAAQYLENFSTLADKQTGVKNTFDQLLLLYAIVRSRSTPDQAVAAILSGTYDPKSPPSWPISAQTRSLLNFVLLGTWFDPTDPSDEGTIVTPALYSESLVWLIAQAHPVGASKLAYGHWAAPPPSLQSLIG